jgi:hypothetical protein
MFMRVNSKCAHQERPPPSRIQGGSGGGRADGKHFATDRYSQEQLRSTPSSSLAPYRTPLNSTMPEIVTVLRLGWNPRATTLTILDKIFKPSAAN